VSTGSGVIMLRWIIIYQTSRVRSDGKGVDKLIEKSGEAFSGDIEVTWWLDQPLAGNF
jgi:hypothetical protein